MIRIDAIWLATEPLDMRAGPSDRQGHPTSGLLAQMMIAKYDGHQPLYRQAQIFARIGVAIQRSTLAEWIGICGGRLLPLIDALRETLLTEPILHVAKRRPWARRRCTRATSGPMPLRLRRAEGSDLRLRARARRWQRHWIKPKALQRRLASQRPACCQHHEPYPVRQAEWPRTACLPERRANSVTDEKASQIHELSLQYWKPAD